MQPPLRRTVTTCETHLHNNTGAPNNFPSLARVVDLAKACPFTKLLVVVHFDQWDLVFIAQSLYQFLVHWFIAVFCQNTQQGLSPATTSATVFNWV
jgi:hypothetical protein